MIIYNARVYTMDPKQPLVTALMIRDGRIVAMGDDETVRGGGVGGIDLGGRTVIPGLTDAHIHLESYALSLKKVDCETDSRQECLARVAERAQHTPLGEWILGHGWNQNNWEDGFGEAADLDAVAPHNPVYLTAKSLHAGWANTAALRLANIGMSTPDPPDGRLGREASGKPNGILFEGAMDLVYQVIPEASQEQVTKAIHNAQTVLWRMGLTGAHDFDRRNCFVALQELRQRGELGLRVLKSIPLEDLSHAVALGLRSGFGDDYLRIGGVKMFADGALGPHTAAMFMPYEDDPQNRGMLFLDEEQIYEHGRLAVENGLSLAVHAIGDRANHEVLEAYAQLRDFGCQLEELGRTKPRLRHRIEHVQVIHPDDASRLAELGVVASMQPIHAPSDMRMADRYWGERSALAYAWRTQLQVGAVLAFGSDAPVESPNPFWGLHAAVTRRRADGSPGPQGWYPEQRLSLQEALYGFTTGAAIAAGWEDRLGCLAPGYLADLLVLEIDPFQCEAEALRDIQPAATMVGGKWVYNDL